MEKAIKVAREQGYTRFDTDNEILAEWDNQEGGGEVSGHFLLDPLFWSALGKSLGWPAKMCLNCGAVNFIICCDGTKVEGWEFFWHKLIHNLAESKSVESFFEELIK